MRILVYCLSAFLSMMSYSLVAADNTLITMPGPKPALAKSWKKLTDGKYEFSLDTSKKLKKGPLTFAVVKESVERKLKRKFSAEVTGNDQKVTISFTGDEQKFLEKLAKAKIKHRKKMEIAAASSVSSAGIRALTAAREPEMDEIKGVALKSGVGKFKLMVQKKGTSTLTKAIATRPTEFKCTNFKVERGDVVFLKPVKKVGSIWESKDCLVAK